jgi:hypothetical protein
MTEPRLLVAASSHRSGSTLLQRYVTARTTTFIWGENGPFIESLIQAVEGWPQTKRNQREYERVILDPSLSERRYVPNLSPPREAVERALRDAVLATYATLPSGYDGWGWKAVGYRQREIDFVRSFFPATRLILLVRDPWDVARSVRRKGWIDRRGYFANTGEVAEHWLRGTEDLVRFAEEDRDGACFFLRYEDLRDRLSELNRFLGVEDEPPRELEIVGRKLGIAPRMSRFRITEDDMTAVTRIAGDTAATLGYSPPEVHAPGAGTDPARIGG